MKVITTPGEEDGGTDVVVPAKGLFEDSREVRILMKLNFSVYYSCTKLRSHRMPSRVSFSCCLLASN